MITHCGIRRGAFYGGGLRFTSIRRAARALPNESNVKFALKGKDRCEA
jgi:hypothetical protein